MGMANLQRMAQQMQQDLLRIQGELETLMVDGSAGGGVVKAVVTGKQELVVGDDRPVRGRPVRRRHAPGPDRRRRQRRAPAPRARSRRRRCRPSPAASASPACDPRRVPTPLIEPVARLIEAFARLPGVGPKTAQRLTFHVLRAPDAEARTLAAALVAVRDQVVFCDRCFNISDAPLCPICRDDSRDPLRLCVVEEPLDVLALERTGEFRGLYHVLHGAISPIDGVGPDRLKIRELLARADEAKRDGEPLEEVILATNPTLEGEATAMYLAERLEGDVGVVSRIARGLPVGGDLEYADEVTLIRALQGRRAV